MCRSTRTLVNFEPPATSLVTDAPPRKRETEAARARARENTGRRRSISPMATTSTRKAPPPRKVATKASSARSASPSRPFLRFYHSEALRKETLSALASLEGAKDAVAHRDALAELVVELTNSGLDYYFMQPLKAAKPGFIVQQSASLGLAGATQVMGSVIRNIIGRMDAAQLLSVSGSIRQLMK
jgi:hypothetical protein